MMHGTFYALITLMQKIVIFVSFEFEEKYAFYFTNYERFDKCMYGTCGGSVAPTKLRTTVIDQTF